MGHAVGKPLETLRGHSNAVQHLLFGQDGKTLYTVSSDGTAIAWDITGRGGVSGHSRSPTTATSTSRSTAIQACSARTAG